MIDSFRGQYSFLANFHSAPTGIYHLLFPTSEHAFQAAKCADPQDYPRFLTGTAGDAKKLGRRIEIRADWEHVKVQVMRAVVYDKFTRNPELGALLRATGDQQLVEGNTWNDFFWGVCRGNGDNWLGKILMEVRGVI
jgi:ribA/ribD-fused uncharacterized protein